MSAQAKGIDYHQLLSDRPWPFMAFVQKLAHLMGRKGSISSFQSQELETLKKCYNRIPALNESLLTSVFHMKSSGASEKIFDSDAKDLIHEFSAGIPRQINAISTACLINASVKKSQKITPDIFHRALTELQSF